MTQTAGKTQPAEIQRRVNEIVAAMIGKGLREPDCKFQFRANADPQAFVTWRNLKPRDRSDDVKFQFFAGADINALLDEALAFVAAMPDRDQTRMNEFMTALGSVIDLGRENGVEVETLNPLMATMKRLSENALTHHAGAAS